MTLCLAAIVVPAALEEGFADWLMDNPLVAGFTSFAVAGHGSSETRMSLAEKVSGRTRRIMFQIHLQRTQADELLAQVKRDYAGTDLHFMLSPLLEAGQLNENG